MTKKKKKTATPPWKKKAPAKKRTGPLTDASKKWAKTRAKKAGRTYPNLVDNLAAAKKKKKRG